MRTLIILVVGLLSVGCLTPEQKQKALRDSVVGEHEIENSDGDAFKLILLENGIQKSYLNGKKPVEDKWTIENGEIHAGSGFIDVYRINKDSSITWIALIHKDGKREELPKERLLTFKRIK